MEQIDLETYQSLARLLNNTPHTPLFFDVFEDFVCALLSKNPDCDIQLSKPRSEATIGCLKPFNLYRLQLVVPKLSEAWSTGMAQKLNGLEPLSNNALLYESNDIRESLLGLLPGRELNDDIVNGYLGLIRAQTKGEQCCIATTRLMSGLKHGHIDQTIDEHAFSSFKTIIVPIHHSRHWTFAVLRTERNIMQIVYYDSVCPAAQPSLPLKFHQWLQKTFPGLEHKLAKNVGPQQEMGNDCGVFMLMGIRLTAAGASHLAQDMANEVIPSFRARILAELLQSRLNPKPNEYYELVEREKISSVGAAVVPISTGVVSGSGATSSQPMVIEDSPVEDDTLQDIASSIFPEVLSLQTEFGTLHTSETEPQMVLASCFDNPMSLPAYNGESSSDRLVDAATDTESRFEVPLHAAAQKESTKGPFDGQSPVPEQLDISSVQDSGAVENLSIAKPVRAEILQGYAREYASEVAIYENLSTAVRMQRISKPRRLQLGPSELATLWSLLEAEEIKPRSLQLRQGRQSFSEQFLKEKKELSKSKNQPQIEHALKKSLGIDLFDKEGTRRLRSATSQAQKASIWTDLANIFQDTLGDNKYVALSATLESTTKIEAIRVEERHQFLGMICSRMSSPGDQMMKRLAAASPLYSAVMHHTLPRTIIYIETWKAQWPCQEPDSFEEIVSLEPPPRRALPKRLKRAVQENNSYVY